jgi:hypothetical protein
MNIRTIVLGSALAAILCGPGLAQQYPQTNKPAETGSPGMQEGEGHYQNAPAGQRIQYVHGAPCARYGGGYMNSTYSPAAQHNAQTGSNGLTPTSRLPNCNPLQSSAAGGAGRQGLANGNGTHIVHN